MQAAVRHADHAERWVSGLPDLLLQAHTPQAARHRGAAARARAADRQAARAARAERASGLPDLLLQAHNPQATKRHRGAAARVRAANRYATPTMQVAASSR